MKKNPFQVIPGGKMESSAASHEHALQEVWFMNIDGEGNEVGEPIRIGLAADGTADISQVPTQWRERWEKMGVPDALGFSQVFPHQGTRFLAALLRRSGPYLRIKRTNP